MSAKIGSIAGLTSWHWLLEGIIRLDGLLGLGLASARGHCKIGEFAGLGPSEC